MKTFKRFLVLGLFLLLTLTGCSAKESSIEASIDAISDMCRVNYAPVSEDEKQDGYDEYKGTFITDDALDSFFNLDSSTKIATNVTMYDFNCVYVNSLSSSMGSYYEATLSLKNTSNISTNLRIRFSLDEDNKIYLVNVYNNTNTT